MDEPTTPQWRIKSFSMSQGWKDKDQYSGSVAFENGEGDEFKFKLTDVHTRMFMEILAPRISESASELTEKLLSSIKE